MFEEVFVNTKENVFYSNVEVSARDVEGVIYVDEFGSISFVDASMDLVNGFMHVVWGVEGERDRAVFNRGITMHGREVEGNKANEGHCWWR